MDLGLQNSFENLLQVFFDIFRDSGSSGRNNSNKELCLGGPAGCLKNFDVGDKK